MKALVAALVLSVTLLAVPVSAQVGAAGAPYNPCLYYSCESTPSLPTWVWWVYGSVVGLMPLFVVCSGTTCSR